MKLMLVFLALLCSSLTRGQDNPLLPKDKTALLIIDVQQFYFPGGALPLESPEKASKKAGELLQSFRNEKMLVVHIRHDAKSEAEIHRDVQPLDDEKVITKTEANSFLGTELLDYLKEKEVTHLVITGMMTHMCVEATVRAAHDFGFTCFVAEDACTTRDLTYNDITIKAKDVHFSTLHTINWSYGKVLTVDEVKKILSE